MAARRVSFGSKRESASLGLMSALASCGHNRANSFDAPKARRKLVTSVALTDTSLALSPGFASGLFYSHTARIEEPRRAGGRATCGTRCKWSELTKCWTPRISWRAAVSHKQNPTLTRSSDRRATWPMVGRSGNASERVAVVTAIARRLLVLKRHARSAFTGSGLGRTTAVSRRFH